MPEEDKQKNFRGIKEETSSLRRLDINEERYFNRHYRLSSNRYVNGLAYFFLTSPKLNIDPEGEGEVNVNASEFLEEMHKNPKDNQLLNYLQYAKSGGRRFIIPLTNAFRSFENQDTVLQTEQYAETFSGYKQTLPKSFIESTAAGEFQITYDEWSRLQILKIHKVWVDYIHNVQRGKFRPFSTSIDNNVLEYASSAYYFDLAEDGETIKYYSKYTGVFPTAVPYSSFEFNRGERNIVDHQIPYVFTYKEDMEPEILSDFNLVSTGEAEPYRIEGLLQNIKEGIMNVATNTKNLFSSSGEQSLSEEEANKVKVEKEGNDYKLKFYTE